MVEALAIVSIAAVVGASLNTLRGYLGSDDKTYSVKKLAGSVIIAVVSALALAPTLKLEGLSPIAIGLLGLVTGFTSDFVISKAKK